MAVLYPFSFPAFCQHDNFRVCPLSPSLETFSSQMVQFLFLPFPVLFPPHPPSHGCLYHRLLFLVLPSFPRTEVFRFPSGHHPSPFKPFLRLYSPPLFVGLLSPQSTLPPCLIFRAFFGPPPSYLQTVPKSRNHND